MRKESITHRAERQLSMSGPTRVLFFVWMSFFPLLSPEASPAYQRDPAADHPMEARTTPKDLMLTQRRQSDRFRNRYEQWQKMGPDEKETLRRRMDQWNQMPPQERQLYQRRFDQWKGLSPEEQRQLGQKLQNWKGLPPSEKEDIRRRFR